jgi:alkanesulfonate monooxygenase SsuD/methylene tetrahydromethanopterin reductase-like flavin-dependent oxidoreductase (luciferase family)
VSDMRGVSEPAKQQVSFGIRLANSGPLASPGAVLALARRSEDRGFDSVWVHDHVSWGEDQITHFSAGAIEACAGQAPVFLESVTTVAAVGIAGLALPLRDPRILAKQVASIDAMIGGGRLVLAIGVGSRPEDFRVMGVPWQRRGRITNDYLGALRAILGSTGPVDFASEAVAFERGTFQPSGSGVEVWVAASSAAGLARAARLSDGWLTAGQSIENYAAAARDWQVAIEQAGRDPRTLTAAYEVFACIKGSHEEAVRGAQASLIYMYGDLDEGLQRTIVGAPEACIERIQQLIDLGVRSFELRLISSSTAEMEEMVDLVAETILPAFSTVRAVVG